MYIDNRVIVALWPRSDVVAQNWGDLLNPTLIHRLSEQPVVHASDVIGWETRPVYRVIGSGLAGTSPNHVIWGMGFLDGRSQIEHRPFTVCAVRGPLSRERILAHNIECPEIFGDPAVLFPLFYNPTVDKVFDVGFIQHTRERGRVRAPLAPSGVSALNIDICSGIEEVVRQVKACRTIISSSLHGIICAHAYGIPSYWLKASDLPLGDDFKFRDYYASIGHMKVEPAVMNEDGTVNCGSSPSGPASSLIDAEMLIRSCPFISPSRSEALVRLLSIQRESGLSGIIFNHQEHSHQAS